MKIFIIICSRFFALVLSVLLVMSDQLSATNARSNCDVFFPMKTNSERPLARFTESNRINLLRNARVLGLKDKQAAMNSRESCKNCQESHLIRIAWHIIHDSKGKGNVSNEKIRDQLQVLNGELQSHKVSFKSWSPICFSLLYF